MGISVFGAAPPDLEQFNLRVTYDIMDQPILLLVLCIPNLITGCRQCRVLELPTSRVPFGAILFCQQRTLLTCGRVAFGSWLLGGSIVIGHKPLKQVAPSLFCWMTSVR